MELYIPTETGELLAFWAAVMTCLLGLVVLLAPGLVLRALGVPVREGRVCAELRSALGGFPLGLGLAALLLAQPMVYLALGGALAFAALARLGSIVADRAHTPANWIFLAVQIALCALPLTYVFGYV